MIFITYQQRHHMANNMRYKGNVAASNNTSVIMFLVDSFPIIKKEKNRAIYDFQKSSSVVLF